MTNLRQYSIRIFGITLRVAVLAMAIGLVLTAVATPAVQAQTYTALHNFSGSDGADPYAGLTIDARGNLYGTTAYGGTSGTVFKLSYKGSAWVLTSLYQFAGGSDGARPHARVIFGQDGSLYGTTQSGGGNGCFGDGCGTIFKLKPAATACKTSLCPLSETMLYRFNGGADGASPSGEVVFDQAGSLYGTAPLGGLMAGSCAGFGCGLVYELTPEGNNWVRSTPYTFTGGSDGTMPIAGLILDKVGNIFGVTAGEGAAYGTVFELVPSEPSWTENTLYTFQDGNDGGIPGGGLSFDPAGNLYGTTSIGGTGQGGTAFELMVSSGWSFSTLYGFVGTGYLCGPNAALAMDQYGDLYGTTVCDGAYGYGSVFKLKRSNGSWTYIPLHDFCSAGPPCIDGENPRSNVVFDMMGNLYGTASAGGAYGDGVVWQITP